MATHGIELTELTEEISLVGMRLARRLDEFLAEADGSIKDLVDARARQLAGELLGEDEFAANQAASTLRAILVPLEPPSVNWWATLPGRAYAWIHGYGQRNVPFVHAAGILGVSRQRISQLKIDGELETISDRWVDNDSLLARLHERGYQG